MTALEDWEKAIELAKDAGVYGWAVMNHDTCTAAIESLKCCANCAHGCSSPYESVWDCDAGETIMGVSADDSCHFTPSCWQETK